MHRRQALSAAALAVAATLGFARDAAAQDAAPFPAAAAGAHEVGVAGVRRLGDAYEVSLVNRGRLPVRDVRIAVTHPFRWNDETNPGASSPSRAEVLVYEGTLEPGQSATFQMRPSPPLPERPDGEFAEPRAEVLAYTVIGAR